MSSVNQSDHHVRPNLLLVLLQEGPSPHLGQLHPVLDDAGGDGRTSVPSHGSSDLQVLDPTYLASSHWKGSQLS